MQNCDQYHKLIDRCQRNLVYRECHESHKIDLLTKFQGWQLVKITSLTTRLLLATIAGISLASCATSSGVFRIDENKFRIATRATWELGGRAGANKMALDQATQYCAKQNAFLKVITSVDDYGHFEGGTVEMTFSCEPRKS